MKKIAWRPLITAATPSLQHTRGVQKVRRLTQLATRYAHHILSVFNIVSCNWNELGPEFLQSSDSVIEELLFLVFQPAICRAIRIRIRMANIVGDGVVQSRHFGCQQVLELTCDQVRCPVGFEPTSKNNKQYFHFCRFVQTSKLER